MTVMPLNLLLEIILKHIATHPNITLLFNHKVTSLTQTPDSAILVVEVSRPNDIVHTQTFSADYILACDGSSSTLRSLIFGPHHWPGMTWPETLAVQNVHYAGFAAHGWTGAHYLISPEHPGLVAERGKGGLWRITLIETHPDAHTLQHDPEAWAARRAEHFRAIFPGHPEPGDYTVEETDWYKAHNRSVARMRAGRVLFAGDAAHTCNPAGGYGAMAGILDASGLADCLVGLYRGWCGEEILDVYSRVRMDKFREYVDRRSALNYRRLTEADADRVLEEEGRGGDRLLRLLKGLEDRPEEARTFLLVSEREGESGVSLAFLAKTFHLLPFPSPLGPPVTQFPFTTEPSLSPFLSNLFPRHPLAFTIPQGRQWTNPSPRSLKTHRNTPKSNTTSSSTGTVPDLRLLPPSAPPTAPLPRIPVEVSFEDETGGRD